MPLTDKLYLGRPYGEGNRCAARLRGCSGSGTRGAPPASSEDILSSARRTCGGKEREGALSLHALGRSSTASLLGLRLQARRRLWYHGEASRQYAPRLSVVYVTGVGRVRSGHGLGDRLRDNGDLRPTSLSPTRASIAFLTYSPALRACIERDDQ